MKLNFFKTGDLILNYHKVFPDNDLPKANDSLVVSVSKFKEQLLFLKENYNLVSLDDLLNFEKNKRAKISITFDDGYKDNLIHALPILKELNVPATVYVVTKFLKGELSLWWRELHEYIFENSNNVKFTYNEKKYDLLINNNFEKKKTFTKLREEIKKLNKSEQAKFLFAITKTKERKQYKNEFLSAEDIKVLNSNPLITIGAHTHNHLSLKNLTKNECIEEIVTSKKILENLLSCKIEHFSYPYGTNHDVGKREFQIVKDLGFKSAVTTSVGKLKKRNLFNLSRIHINQNANKDILKLKLSIYYFFYKKTRELFS